MSQPLAIAASVLTAEFKKDFGDILKKKGVAPNDHLKELKACLSENKLMWKETEVDPKLFLPHKKTIGAAYSYHPTTCIVTQPRSWHLVLTWRT